MYLWFLITVGPAFGSAQSAGKAVKKAQAALPHSPRKSAHVIKSLVSEYLPVDANFSDNRGRKGLSDAVLKRVACFYENDEISRMAPGKKDAIKVGSEMVQKRHLYNNISETYELYKNDNTGDDIGRSKFASLRPRHVLPFNDVPHTVCVCAMHENMKFIIDALKKTGENIPATGRELVDLCVCSRDNALCMKINDGSCVGCKDPESVYSIAEVEGDFCWNKWATIDGRSMKTRQSGSAKELMAVLNNQWKTYLNHCYYKDKQAKYFDQKRSTLSAEECLIQVDFSENYQTGYQDEIQSAHFTYKQVTIFTCCVWTTLGVRSYAVVSDYLQHDKYAVYTFLQGLIGAVKQDNPHITSVCLFSDGAASQFKQRFILSNLNHLKAANDLEQFEWNFFASSHGKGAVDGVGGTLKRQVWRLVKARKAIVEDAKSFCDVAKKHSNIIIMPINSPAIVANKAFLDEKWEGVKGIPALQKVHHVVARGNNSVDYSTVAGMVTSLHQFKAGPRSSGRLLDSDIVDNL